MNTLTIGTQYIALQNGKLLFDAVYTGNIREQIFTFDGGPSCSYRLTADDMKKLTFVPDPITTNS